MTYISSQQAEDFREKLAKIVKVNLNSACTNPDCKLPKFTHVMFEITSLVGRHKEYEALSNKTPTRSKEDLEPIINLLNELLPRLKVFLPYSENYSEILNKVLAGFGPKQGCPEVPEHLKSLLVAKLEGTIKGYIHEQELENTIQYLLWLKKKLMEASDKDSSLLNQIRGKKINNEFLVKELATVYEDTFGKMEIKTDFIGENDQELPTGKVIAFISQILIDFFDDELSPTAIKKYIYTKKNAE